MWIKFPFLGKLKTKQWGRLDRPIRKGLVTTKLRTLLLAALLLLPALWGIDGVWLAVTAAELATLAVTVYMFVTKDQKFHYRHA